MNIAAPFGNLRIGQNFERVLQFVGDNARQMSIAAVGVVPIDENPKQAKRSRTGH